jgi:hypothetical protein
MSCGDLYHLLGIDKGFPEAGIRRVERKCRWLEAGSWFFSQLDRGPTPTAKTDSARWADWCQAMADLAPDLAAAQAS